RVLPPPPIEGYRRLGALPTAPHGWWYGWRRSSTERRLAGGRSRTTHAAAAGGGGGGHAGGAAGRVRMVRRRPARAAGRRSCRRPVGVGAGAGRLPAEDGGRGRG